MACVDRNTPNRCLGLFVRSDDFQAIRIRLSVSDPNPRRRTFKSNGSGSTNHVIMFKIFRLVVLFIFVAGASPVFSAENAVDSETVSTTADGFDWEPVMNAIIQVESRGNVKAVSGNSCGAMQITPVLVMECNNILKKRKSKKRFSLRDRFDLAKSKEMFVLIQSYFNPQNDIEKAIRAWNGGYRYSVKRTQKYFNKVMAYLNSKN